MQKFATLNGEKIAYSDVGQGQPIVCLHGWAMHKDLFSNLAESLSGQFRIISIDLAGHGNSKSVGGSYTIERAANDVSLLCEILGLTNIIALGWSMGMQVWWEMIDKHGHARLSGLVSVDMSPKVYNTQDWNNGTINGRTIDGIEEMLDDMCQDWTTFTYRFVPRIFAKGLGDSWAALAERLMHDTLRNDPQIMASYWRSMASKDYRCLLKTINIPTLIVRGELSQLYGSGAATFMQKISPKAHIKILALSGHAPHIEQPEHFTEMLADFAAKTHNSAEISSGDNVITKGDHHVQI